MKYGKLVLTIVYRIQSVIIVDIILRVIVRDLQSEECIIIVYTLAKVNSLS